MSSVYQVVLVQEDHDHHSATLHEAPFASREAATAKLFADAFNERELADPLGLWAIVRCEEEEDFEF
jgi:hypothetical protein